MQDKNFRVKQIDRATEDTIREMFIGRLDELEELHRAELQIIQEMREAFERGELY